jgi:hypothetical protein
LEPLAMAASGSESSRSANMLHTSAGDPTFVPGLRKRSDGIGTGVTRYYLPHSAQPRRRLERCRHRG